MAGALQPAALSPTTWCGEVRRLALLAVLVAGPAMAQDAPKPAFDPVGRWKMYHTDGTTFIARLTADQQATTNFGGGEHGIWRPEGNAIRILYTDGWDDLLVRHSDAAFGKRGWAPGDDRCGPSANDTRAEHISIDPGPPL